MLLPQHPMPQGPKFLAMITRQKRSGTVLLKQEDKTLFICGLSDHYSFTVLTMYF